MTDKTPTDTPEPVTPIDIDMNEAANCPKCGADWQGDPIPETHREHFGGATHFRRVLARYDRELARTVEFQCPDCEAVFPRG